MAAHCTARLQLALVRQTLDTQTCQKKICTLVKYFYHSYQFEVKLKSVITDKPISQSYKPSKQLCRYQETENYSALYVTLPRNHLTTPDNKLLMTELSRHHYFSVDNYL